MAAFPVDIENSLISKCQVFVVWVTTFQFEQQLNVPQNCSSLSSKKSCCCFLHLACSESRFATNDKEADSGRLKASRCCIGLQQLSRRPRAVIIDGHCVIDCCNDSNQWLLGCCCCYDADVLLWPWYKSVIYLGSVSTRFTPQYMTYTLSTHVIMSNLL